METWTWRGTMAAMVVAVAVAGVGGAAIYAATGSSAHGAGMHFAGPPGGPPPAADPPRPASDGTLHGESVRADGHGGYTTELSQTGTVTSAAPGSLSVRSSDGYTATYRVPASAAPQFVVGDVVVVTGERKGEAAVLDTVRPPLTPGH